MSVDKFGRFDRGDKSKGFQLTASGDYDAQEKLVRNVKEPILANDAATKGYVQKSRIPQTLEGHYNFGGKRLKNLGIPTDSQDATTVSFVQANCLPLSESNSHYDAKHRCIRNVSLPLLPTDTATMQYVQDYTIGRNAERHYTVKNQMLRDLRDPILPTDAATMGFVSKRVLKRTHPDGNVDLEGKLVRNLGNAVLPTDAVNMEYVDKHVPKQSDDYWTFSNKRLSNVQDPLYDGEAVNLRTLYSMALTKRSKSYNHYDAGGGKVVNVGDCTGDGDVVNFKVLRKHLKKWDTAQDTKLRQLGSAIYNFLKQQSGRAAQEGLNSENYLNWNEILNVEVLGETNEEEEDDDEKSHSRTKRP